LNVHKGLVKKRIFEELQLMSKTTLTVPYEVEMIHIEEMGLSVLEK